MKYTGLSVFKMQLRLEKHKRMVACMRGNRYLENICEFANKSIATHCHLCFRNAVLANPKEPFKTTLSRILLSFWSILLIYHLSLLLFHVFITKGCACRPFARKNSTSAHHFPDITFYRIFKNRFRNHQKHGILRV